MPYIPNRRPKPKPPQNNVMAISKALNSDGAGGYYAVWTIENYLVKSLFVLHDF